VAVMAEAWPVSKCAVVTPTPVRTGTSTALRPGEFMRPWLCTLVAGAEMRPCFCGVICDYWSMEELLKRRSWALIIGLFRRRRHPGAPRMARVRRPGGQWLGCRPPVAHHTAALRAGVI
jgi:hypothetical protein